ncbi:hypothetical protein SO802_022229 [Lithocarpus litseifolius]|uniref:Uncharacterized protein n=1 Tax=Lithocarpus litseifolius TaxID=425828 RepID=A0AAW2CII4_9ROSI
MNPYPHSISCPQRTFEQSIKELSTKKLKELSVKLMKDVQDRIVQMKQKKTQTDSIGKLRILDHKELITTPIEDNIDDDILVVENPPATPKPNVDTDVHASTSVTLTCVLDMRVVGKISSTVKAIQMDQVKDSANYLDHINGKKHQRVLGMSMQIERASVDQAKQRYEVQKNPGSFTEQDLDEGILKQQQEEEERKRQRREKKKK